MLHIATLFAVCIVFRHSILSVLRMLRLSFRKECTTERREICKIILATAITGLIAVFLQKLLYTDVFILGFAFLATALILATTFFARPRKATITFSRAIIIGIVQGIAIFPGISRSGITIAAGLQTGVDARQSANFTFILSIPTIIAALLFSISDIKQLDTSLFVLFVGMVMAFLSGYFALRLLLRLLHRGRLYLFSPYLFILAVICIFL